MATLIQGLPPAAGSVAVTTFTMDATTDFIAFRFLALTTAPIVKAEVFVGTKTGTPGNLECVLTANVAAIPEVSGGVPVDVGGGSPTLVSIAQASISTASRVTITFTNAFTPTAGTWYWLVLYPGAGGSGWSGSHRYIWRQGVGAGGVSYGGEATATSTDTGGTFTHGTVIPYASFLTTGDAYLPTLASCCFDAAGTTDVDDTSNPDERGTAFLVPANTTAMIYGLSFVNRSESATSDFSVSCYSNDTQLATRAIDQSELVNTSGTNLNGSFSFLAGQTVAAGATGRVAVKSTNATEFIRHGVYEFGTQARRESARLFRDSWYCHQNGGSGGFTDDKTRWYGIEPHVEFNGSGGSGGAGSTYNMWNQSG